MNNITKYYIVKCKSYVVRRLSFVVCRSSYVFTYFYGKFPKIVMKRNGIARPNWTFIFVHFSKMPRKVCKDPSQKTRCYHSALFLKIS